MLKYLLPMITIFGLASPALADSGAALRPDWQGAFAAVNATLESNLHPPDAWVPFYHAQPAPKFNGIYLWDSAFISLIWKDRNPAIAQDIVRSVLYFQGADGRLSLMVGHFGASDFTQPPLLSFAAARIAQATGDAKFIQDVYEPLKRYQNWMWANRKLSNGLFFWKHPYESGIDNSPRFGTRDESSYIDTTDIAAVDLASYIVIDAESMATLAKLQLGKVPANSSFANELRSDLALFQSRAEEVRTLARRYLWDESTGYFYDRNISTGQFIKIATIASVLPVFAGIPTFDQYLRLRVHIADAQGFNTPIPFPTVARGDAAFEKDCWRGPVWLNTGYMMIQGLKRYRDDSLAHDMASRLVDGVYQTWNTTGELVEFYDPERYDFSELSRKKGIGPFGLSGSHDIIQVIEQLVGKQIYLGTKPVDHFVGWTGLVNTIVIEEGL